MKDTYLITGSAGFIGSNLVRHLMYVNNCNIVGIDKLNSIISMHNVYVNKSHDFYIGDVRDKKFLNKIFELFQPSKVIHLAESQKICKELKGIENVLYCCEKYNIQKLIYLTSQTYNDSYSCVVKQAAENLISISKVPFYILRTPEIFGPRQNPGTIPNFIYHIMNKQTIFTSHVNTSRNLLYVEDVCKAINSACDIKDSGIIELANDNCMTDLELISFMVNKIIPYDVDFIRNKIQSMSTNEISDKLSSNCSQINWKPGILNEQLKYTINWYKNNKWIWK